ncbi:UNKNOWN [Stylonychia lemnae]|uniref:Uncharacterized protein n=1 Tax=Stylonychia lemnae TaxID=5949 RepID=A0A078B973_STYLE|nr:UNKNOWN [Stylonychia lemnae]|eukprot:CDW90786.1 UNKNOWN [Stylonychia lemnae]
MNLDPHGNRQIGTSISSPNYSSYPSNSQFDNRDETIAKLQEINEKFRSRVAELEDIVFQALDKIQQPDNEDKAERNFFSHRVQPLEDISEISERNLMLKQMQQEINLQKQNIKSLKNKLEAVTNVQRNTDIENQTLDLERQNKERMKLFNSLMNRNEEQKRELQMLNEDTEFGHQMDQINRELAKWKDKHKMLAQYKKEEDMNFKSKFDHLMKVEQERSRIKEAISMIVYAPMDQNNKRGKSQALTGMKKTKFADQDQDVDQLLKTRNAIEKVIDQNTRRYLLTKKEMEYKEQELVEEIENLKLLIVNTERMNEFYFEEVKELNQLNKTLKEDLAFQQRNSILEQATDDEYGINQNSGRNKSLSHSKQRTRAKSRANQNFSVSKSVSNLHKVKQSQDNTDFKIIKKVDHPDNPPAYNNRQFNDSINDRYGETPNTQPKKSNLKRENEIIFRYDNKEIQGVSAINMQNQRSPKIEDKSKVQGSKQQQQQQPLVSQSMEISKNPPKKR